MIDDAISERVAGIVKAFEVETRKRVAERDAAILAALSLDFREGDTVEHRPSGRVHVVAAIYVAELFPGRWGAAVRWEDEWGFSSYLGDALDCRKVVRT